MVDNLNDTAIRGQTYWVLDLKLICEINLAPSASSRPVTTSK